MKKQNLRSVQTNPGDLKQSLNDKNSELAWLKRELEIEASLEKVRARTMAMRRSEELREVVAVLYEQMEPLGLGQGGCEIVLCDEQTNLMQYWSSNEFQSVMGDSYKIPRSIHAFYEQQWEAWKKRIPHLIITLEGKEKRHFEKLTFEKTDFINLPEDVKKSIRSTKVNVFSHVTMKYGLLEAIDSKALPNGKFPILQRFANVFEQTYTRFLDLQKAEAQAREAQIEAALERVRARTMGMHSSEELVEVSTVLYSELRNLDVREFTDCSIVTIDEENNQQTVWAAKTDAEYLEKAIMPLLGDPVLQAIYDSWQQKEAFFTIRIGGFELANHLDFVFPKANRTEKEDLVIQNMPDPTFFHCAFFSQGYLELMADIELSKDAFTVLSRFAKVFEQTYTRFLDLLKAEAQAREAQIEAALERVRARSMAMHKSEELSNAAVLLYNELQGLGLTQYFNCGYVEVKESENKQYVWSSTFDGKWAEGHFIPLTGDPVFDARYEAWKQQVPVFHQIVGGRQLKKHVEFVSPILPTKFKKQINLDFPDPAVFYCCNFNKGYLHIITDDQFNENEKSLLDRFTKVFEQTYTRFLDLQKAEEQAREAQIEAALERVRSRTMAMQQSEELAEVAAVLFDQLNSLGGSQYASGFVLCDKNDPIDEQWMFIDTGIIPPQYIPHEEESAHFNMFKAWQEGAELYEEVLVGDQNLEMAEFLMSQPSVRQNFEHFVKSKDGLPNWQKMHAAFFSKGYLLINTLKEEESSIYVRFAKVFDQTYTRFLDLKKAEAQAREAQIENALEKVRSRSLAMHKSDELQEVITTVLERINDLGLAIDTATICLPSQENKELVVWIASKIESKDYMYSESYSIPFGLKSVIAKDIENVNPNDYDYFAKQYSKKEKDVYYLDLFENSDFRHIPQARKDFLLSVDKYGVSAAVSKNSGIYTLSYSGKILDKQEGELLKRFSRVFEQAYIRFLDLQKAEEQAREALIEASLERVRAKAMAMHSSEDISNAITIVFRELESLGIEMLRCGIGIMVDNIHLDLWTTISAKNADIARIIGRVDQTQHKALRGFLKARREGKKKYNYVLKGKDLISYYQVLKNAPEYPIPLMKSKPQKQVLNYFLFPEGGLFAITKDLLSEDESQVFLKFATVFGMTYQRYLDLVKAEAQAREAQIETALEKVRSRSLAMHKSEELQEVVNTVYDRFIELDIKVDSVNFIIFIEGSKDFINWTGVSGGFYKQSMRLPYVDFGATKDMWSARESGKTFLSLHYSFEEKNKFWQKAFEISALKHVPEERKKFILEADGWVTDMAIEKFSGIQLNRYSNELFLEKDHKVIKRFAKVFEQAYIRFLDLQKAEAQAREAQIEAALERIRAKALAMQFSADLHDVSIVLREQMGILGQPDLESSIVHLYNSSQSLESWYTFRSTETNSSIIVTDVAFIPVDSCDYIKETIEKYNSTESEYTIVSKGKKLADWYNVMVEVAPDTIEYDDSGKILVPKILYYHHSKFSGGALLMISNQPPAEESKELQRRAAQVFNLAYQRFLDLQQAEARARETVKQASLDRVRGEIASMRSKDDLTRITPLIWKELTALGVPFIRCGVLIMDEKRKVIQSYLSAPDGHSLGVFELPFDSKEIARGAIYHWRKETIYKDHWNQKQFIKFTENLVNLGQIQDTETYQGAATPPKSLDLHFVPFKQGMLYVGNSAPLDKDELQLVKSLAEAFAIAYARYEDFTQLEAAKNQMEKAFGELKSTQTQLIHAEKMASLGELTAGIAHEIQNPLNFVNNFSEVSKELIEEMNEEMGSGNMAEVKEITEDIKQNLDKIHHHGQRASSIVKGMLEHSRTGTRVKELTNINILADEYLRLSYHGLRAKDKTFNADFKTELDETLPMILAIAQDISRVLLNLINNAFYAVSIKSKQGIVGYTPTVIISTRKNDKIIEIFVQDNGDGIPKDALDKIFQPFFTTKPTGEGTGLGLSLSYDIITQGHDGHLEVETEEGVGTRFIVQLPIRT